MPQPWPSETRGPYVADAVDAIQWRGNATNVGYSWLITGWRWWRPVSCNFRSQVVADSPPQLRFYQGPMRTEVARVGATGPGDAGFFAHFWFCRGLPPIAVTTGPGALDFLQFGMPEVVVIGDGEFLVHPGAAGGFSITELSATIEGERRR